MQVVTYRAKVQAWPLAVVGLGIGFRSLAPNKSPLIMNIPFVIQWHYTYKP